MQELLLKPAASSKSAAGGLMALVGGNTEAGADASARAAAGSKFRSLLQMFADARTALASLASPNDSVPQPAVDAAKPIQFNADILIAANADAADSKDPWICIKQLPEGHEADPALSADVMSQLSALVQHFPHLREILAGKVDLQAVADAIDYLQMTKTPDLAKFNLPEEVKDALLKLAQHPGALAKVGDLVDKIIQQPQLMAGIKDLKPVDHADIKPVADIDADVQVAEAAGVKQDNNGIKMASLQVAPEVAGQKKAMNVLAEDRLVVDVTLNKPLRNDIAKLMSDTHISAAADAAKAEIFSTGLEANPELSFDQAMTHALHASDALQAGKHSILSAAGLEAYGARNALGANAHIASLQVAVHLQRNLQAGRANAFLIQLQPEELGRIEVTLKFEGSRVRALISAEKEETLDLLKHDAKVLDKALQGAGLETDAGSLEFSLGQNFDKSNEAKKNNHHDRSFGTMIADTVTDTDIKQELSAAHIMMMATGRVDVKL